jgi:beta-mannosidase
VTLIRVPLHSGWTLQCKDGLAPQHVAGTVVPGKVPGTVHTDLLAAGLIEDPYRDDQERVQAWIGRCEWVYETTFEWQPGAHERHDLVFSGLDTVATVELNGRLLGRTANMHRTYRFDALEALRPGANALRVTFGSAVRFADAMSMQLGARPHVNHHPYNAIRKMACNFGWDWGPDLVTAGIWRPVALESWSTARLSEVRPVATVSRGNGRVDVHLGIEQPMEGPALLVRAEVAGVEVEAPVAPGTTSAVLTLEVPDVDLWWPAGHGEQPLYDLRVTLATNGQALQDWTSRIGFRTVVLDTEPDEQGTPFQFVVNGQPVFAKGVNWIPDDAFPHRVTRERYAERLGQAREAGVNLVRVWGGGIYESDDFYAECDERGLLVWQDFLFACAAYAEEEPLRSEVLAEARDNVTRLMPHPSLVLWNGCNENIWGFADWRWDEPLDGRSWGAGYYFHLLPAVVAECDPGRAYSPGSPCSMGADAHPNDPAHGTSHIWDVWNEVDYPVYRQYAPRFAAEFGWQGPPTWSTLTQAVSDDPLTPESPGMLGHQKAIDGNGKLTRGLVRHLPVPDDMEDWHWAMSVNQARAVQTAVEHFRALWPRCSGSVVWQHNDCWPVTSWAAIDGNGHRKPLFYALKHAYADRLVTVQLTETGLAAVLLNDTPAPWRAELRAERRTFDGTVRASASRSVDVAPRSTAWIPLDEAVANPAERRVEVLSVAAGGTRSLWFFAEDRELALRPSSLQVRAWRVEGGFRVEVTAEGLVRDLALLVDKVDPEAVVDDMLVTLLPGESVVFDIASRADVDPSAFTEPRVLRTVNSLLPVSGEAAPPQVLRSRQGET